MLRVGFVSLFLSLMGPSFTLGADIETRQFPPARQVLERLSTEDWQARLSAVLRSISDDVASCARELVVSCAQGPLPEGDATVDWCTLVSNAMRVAALRSQGTDVLPRLGRIVSSTDGQLTAAYLDAVVFARRAQAIEALRTTVTSLPVRDSACALSPWLVRSTIPGGCELVQPLLASVVQGATVTSPPGGMDAIDQQQSLLAELIFMAERQGCRSLASTLHTLRDTETAPAELRDMADHALRRIEEQDREFLVRLLLRGTPAEAERACRLLTEFGVPGIGQEVVHALERLTASDNPATIPHGPVFALVDCCEKTLPETGDSWRLLRLLEGITLKPRNTLQERLRHALVRMGVWDHTFGLGSR